MQSTVIIASAGRSKLLDEMLEHLVSVKGDACDVIVCVPDCASAPTHSFNDVKVILGPRGAAAQRNAAIAQVGADTSYVFFFDDDAFPHVSYIPNAIEAFKLDESLIAITGKVEADGVKLGEISVPSAIHMLSSVTLDAPGGQQSYGLYGCNFVVRSDLLLHEQFDPRLPLYSWLEDEDLARRLARRGKLEMHPSCVCVHLGANSGGRTGHKRFGYSQIVNPIYLWRKGSITLRRAILLASKPLMANIARSIGGDSPATRRQRLRGNAIGIADLIRGRLSPERIVDL